jgi:hypothetical protein
MFDGLDDNEGGPSAAAASYPFALPSAPWVNGAAANPFTTHAVYLRKKEGVSMYYRLLYVIRKLIFCCSDLGFRA